MSDFDVLVVGSGAGGGIAAWKFAQKGKRVLVLERGKAITEEPRDHLRNHRYAKYGHSTGPDTPGNPRVFVGEDGIPRVVQPCDGEYNNNAMALGGGTRVFGAQAWRFHPFDFRMASTYGIPDGSSLADWPLSYEDLDPYYEAIEWELGVSGAGPASNMPGRREYSMEALPNTTRGTRLVEAARGLGWACQRIPMMINTEPHGGRGACIECQHCVGFCCPTEAKGGTQNTVLPIAQHTGLCEIWTEAQAVEIIACQGRVTGVRVVRHGQTLAVSADVVVLAAGAIETARLLLASRTDREPNGIGNNQDQVGRNLQGHYYTGVQGVFSEPINEMRGPGPTVAVTQFSHGNPGVIGGGMLADDFIPLPCHFARDYRKPGVPLHGPALKQWVRYGYRRSFRLFGPVQDIPHPDSRVTLDPSVVDSVGMPVARLQGHTHPATVDTALYLAARADDWMRAAEAKETWRFPVRLGLSAGQHQAGTCRMGGDPKTSVVDADGRVHGHDNLLVCDTSVHVTNGGFNPFLTAMATSLRTADRFK